MTYSLGAAMAAELQVPAYSSRPGAFAKLFLDFDGIDYQGTWGGKTPGKVPAYDIDGDPNSYNATELENIRLMFIRVADKYSPFNINVTTVDPGNDNNLETARIVIGGSNAWYGGGGGVAYLGGFYNSASNTAWVFPDNLGRGHPKYTGECAAHEAGHLFGLDHQSTWVYQNNQWVKTEEYSSNGGSTVKSPTMGLSYYCARGLWWRGTPSYSPTATQDDMALLAGSQNGFGYRPDDHPNTVASASHLTWSTGGLVDPVKGVIERTTDADIFRFHTYAGTVSFLASVVEFGPTLDATLKLFASDGQLLHTIDTDDLGESLSLFLDEGDYAIGIFSRGEYGDVGQYVLSGSVFIPEPAAGAAAAIGAVAIAVRRRRPHA